MDWWRIVCCAAAGYLLGSCNGAIVVSHTCMHDDIRKKGSGNAGLTNFLRNFGGWATLLVVLMDMGKVVLACLLGRWLLPGNPQLGMMIAGAMTELGHIFPVFYGFRGGKGILSSAALAIMMDWRIFVIGFSLFLIIVFATHYVSLGSILAATAYAVLFVIFSRAAVDLEHRHCYGRPCDLHASQQYCPSAPWHGDKNLSFEIQEKVRNLPCR